MKTEPVSWFCGFRLLRLWRRSGRAFRWPQKGAEGAKEDSGFRFNVCGARFGQRSATLGLNPDPSIFYLVHIRSFAALSLALALLSACAKRETPVEEGIRTKTLLVSTGADPPTLIRMSVSSSRSSSCSW